MDAAAERAKMNNPPPLGERFEVREELRWCVYRVGNDEPIAVSKTEAAADVCRAMCERNEWPWYARPKS